MKLIFLFLSYLSQRFQKKSHNFRLLLCARNISSMYHSKILFNPLTMHGNLIWDTITKITSSAVHIFIRVCHKNFRRAVIMFVKYCKRKNNHFLFKLETPAFDILLQFVCFFSKRDFLKAFLYFDSKKSCIFLTERSLKSWQNQFNNFLQKSLVLVNVIIKLGL